MMGRQPASNIINAQMEIVRIQTKKIIIIRRTMMSEKDGLRDFKFAGGLFIKLNSDDSPRKLRIVTTDPVVSMDKFGNTRFGFIAWDYNNDKAGILNTTPGVAKQVQAIHQDEDFGANIKNTDIKITTTGTGIESRHTVTALPTSETLTNEMIGKLREIDLDAKIEEGQRMTYYKPQDEIDQTSGYDKAKAVAADIKSGANKAFPDAVEVSDEEVEEKINLDDIPFN